MPPLSFPVRFYNFLFEKSGRGAAPRATLLLASPSNSPPFPFFTFFIFLAHSLSLPLALGCAAPRRSGAHNERVRETEKRNSRYAGSFGLGIPLRKLWGRAREPREPDNVACILRNRDSRASVLYIESVGTLIRIYRDRYTQGYVREAHRAAPRSSSRPISKTIKENEISKKKGERKRASPAKSNFALATFRR